MKQIKNIILLCALCAFTFTATAADNWVLTLSGNGNTTLNDDGGTVLGGELGLARTGKILVPAELGVRQGFGYASASDTKTFDTQVHFDLFPVKFKRLEIGAGVYAGSTWGDTKPTWSAGPEGVVRVWLLENAGVFGRVQYPLDIAGQKLGDRLNYAVGLTIRF